MSAPSVRSPRVEAMLDAILSRDARDDDYWEDLSVLGKESSGSIVRPLVVARCHRALDRASAETIIRVIDVLVQLGEPVVDAALRFAHHADDAVRTAVAGALEDSRDPRAIAVLAELCGDPARTVRACAIPALMNAGVDTVIVRDALASRLDDDDEVARNDAILGLAMRKDRRALAPLLTLLATEELRGRLVDAAYHLASPELLDALRRHKETGSEMCGEWSLDDAIRACTVDHA